MRSFSYFGLSFALLVLPSCAEVADDDTSPPASSSTAASDDAGSDDDDEKDAGKKSDDKKKDGGKDGDDAQAQPAFNAGAASAVIINEISADGEWVELVNTGEGAVDISGFALADRVKDGTGPKTDEAAKFPQGTILSPRAYVVVQGGGIEAGKTCPTGEQSYCVLAAWGISNKSGETLFFLDPDGAIVNQAEYPASAARTGESWGRSPSGDPKANFVVSLPTPGAKNTPKR